MANVFGVPITNETLKGMKEYQDKKTLTQNDRAKVAMHMKNTDGKDVNAHNFAANLVDRCGSSVATKCMIYNATGNPITLKWYKNQVGHLGESPYPAVLLNGQWGVFVHVGDWDQASSVGALVYSGKINDEGLRYWVISWSNSAAKSTNKVYSLIHVKDEYMGKDEDGNEWEVFDSLESKGRLVEYSNYNEGVIGVSIGGEKVSAMEATLTLPKALGIQADCIDNL